MAEIVQRELSSRVTDLPDKVKPGPRGYTADELVRMDFPEPKWAVRGILMEGLSILAGKPKHGKSLMALLIGLAIAFGGKALGKIDVEKGTVIYLALEDVFRRLKDRIKIMLQDSDGKAPEKLHLFTEWPRMGEGGLKLLETEIQKHADLRLIIIDTLKMFRPHDKVKQNLYERDYDDISRIKKLADKYSVAILIIHHLRKTETDDIMDNFSGSLGLTGAADGMLALQRRTNQADAILHVTGRDVESEEYALKFEPSTISWTLLGQAGVIKSTIARQQIFDAIKDNGEAISPSELSKITGLSYKLIIKILKNFTDDGSIKKISRGKYIYFGDNGAYGDNGDNGDNGDDGDNAPVSLN